MKCVIHCATISIELFHGILVTPDFSLIEARLVCTEYGNSHRLSYSVKWHPVKDNGALPF